MRATLLSWWQQIKQHLVTNLVVAIILIVACALIIVEIKAYGTGFTRKTLWDWLQLLIVPLVLAVIALLFNFATTRNEQKIAAKRFEQDQQIAAQRYENDQYIALDKQREDLLQTYLDRMSELLLEKQLRTSEPNAEVRNVARVRTITILFQLDARRIGYVFSFLREAGLISNKPKSSIVSLSHADLDRINLSGVDLSRTDLSGTTFRGANLSKADLDETNLCGANFYRANLSETSFSEADLSEAFLLGTNLFGADLEKAILKRAVITGANLRAAVLKEADLSDASLAKANLYNADLSGAKLIGANLSEANLEKADIDITVKELVMQAKSLKGATMPDGSIYP